MAPFRCLPPRTNTLHNPLDTAASPWDGSPERTKWRTKLADGSRSYVLHDSRPRKRARSDGGCATAPITGFNSMAGED